MKPTCIHTGKCLSRKHNVRCSENKSCFENTKNMTELTHLYFAEVGFMHLRKLENSNFDEYCLWQTSFKREHFFLYDPDSTRFILFLKNKVVCDCHIKTVRKFVQLANIFWDLNLKNSQPMNPQQKITDLEKRQEEIAKELAELKKEMKPKELTFEEIKLKTLFRDLDSFQMPKGYHQKIYAIRDMIIVANELNGDWKPDQKLPFNQAYALGIDSYGDVIAYATYERLTCCYFKSFALAEEAIKILGVEKIKTALW